MLNTFCNLITTGIITVEEAMSMEEIRKLNYFFDGGIPPAYAPFENKRYSEATVILQTDIIDNSAPSKKNVQEEKFDCEYCDSVKVFPVRGRCPNCGGPLQ